MPRKKVKSIVINYLAFATVEVGKTNVSDNGIIKWQPADDVPSGIYLIEIKSDSNVITKKTLYIK